MAVLPTNMMVSLSTVFLTRIVTLDRYRANDVPHRWNCIPDDIEIVFLMKSISSDLMMEVLHVSSLQLGQMVSMHKIMVLVRKYLCII